MDLATLLDPAPTSPAPSTGAEGLAEGTRADLDEGAAIYAGARAAAETEASANRKHVDLILQRLAGRPDGTLDLERLARLVVVAALRIDCHIDDHQENPWWEQ